MILFLVLILSLFIILKIAIFMKERKEFYFSSNNDLGKCYRLMGLSSIIFHANFKYWDNKNQQLSLLPYL